MIKRSILGRTAGYCKTICSLVVNTRIINEALAGCEFVFAKKKGTPQSVPSHRGEVFQRNSKVVEAITPGSDVTPCFAGNTFRESGLEPWAPGAGGNPYFVEPADNLLLLWAETGLELS